MHPGPKHDTSSGCHCGTIPFAGRVHEECDDADPGTSGLPFGHPLSVVSSWDSDNIDKRMIRLMLYYVLISSIFTVPRQDFTEESVILTRVSDEL
jgi:hypothetical protein